MGNLLDKVERALFGATAQERVDMMTELVARRVEQRLVAALEADAADADEQTDDRRQQQPRHERSDA